MAGIDDWLSVARADDPDDVRERILTGYRDGKPFTPYVPTLAMPASVTTVLDFGCGLGRNFPYLTSIAREVVGFDLPPMIERCRTVGTHPVACLTSDWPEVLTRRFDLIVATLVLQHIETAACRAYLEDFARLAPVSYVLTRVRSDFGAQRPAARLGHGPLRRRRVRRSRARSRDAPAARAGPRGVRHASRGGGWRAL